MTNFREDLKMMEAALEDVAQAHGLAVSDLTEILNEPRRDERELLIRMLPLEREKV